MLGRILTHVCAHALEHYVTHASCVYSHAVFIESDIKVVRHPNQHSRFH